MTEEGWPCRSSNKELQNIYPFPQIFFSLWVLISFKAFDNMLWKRFQLFYVPDGHCNINR
jgi:hypothetical protein